MYDYKYLQKLFQGAGIYNNYILYIPAIKMLICRIRLFLYKIFLQPLVLLLHFYNRSVIIPLILMYYICITKRHLRGE